MKVAVGEGDDDPVRGERERGGGLERCCPTSEVSHRPALTAEGTREGLIVFNQLLITRRDTWCEKVVVRVAAAAAASKSVTFSLSSPPNVAPFFWRRREEDPKMVVVLSLLLMLLLLFGKTVVDKMPATPC